MTTVERTKDDHRVTVPEGELDGLRVERFELTRSQAAIASLRAGPGRALLPGTHTRLMDGDKLWMSDTHGELYDHTIAICHIQNIGTRRVLINGLGLGMVVKAALDCEHVEHVDVVEIDPRVVALVGPHYQADPRVTIHTADAIEQTSKWPPNTRWDVAWHDIWPEINEANRPDMRRLHGSYGRRVGWQGSWGRDFLDRLRAHQREQERRLACS
jgi:hypothetical protein